MRLTARVMTVRKRATSPYCQLRSCRRRSRSVRNATTCSVASPKPSSNVFGRPCSVTAGVPPGPGMGVREKLANALFQLVNALQIGAGRIVAPEDVRELPELRVVHLEAAELFD